MIETKDITKMVHHIVRRNRGVADPQIMHPMREWVIGICVTLFGVLCGSILAASLYRYYDAKKDVIVTVTETPVPYNATVVEEALLEYRTKQAEYAAVAQIQAGGEVVEAFISTSTTATTSPESLPEDETVSEEVTPEEVIDEEPVETVVVPDLAI